MRGSSKSQDDGDGGDKRELLQITWRRLESLD